MTEPHISTPQPCGLPISQPVQITSSSLTGRLKPQVPNLWPWYLNNVLKHQRPHKYSKNEERLAQALPMLSNQDLIGETLLDRAVRKRHAANLRRRLMRQLEKSLLSKKPDRRKLRQYGESEIGYFECKQDQNARALIGMFTIVQSLVALDVPTALLEAEKLKTKATHLFKSVPDSAFIAAIEVEVTSIKQMRRVQKFNQGQNSSNFSVDEDGVLTNAVPIDGGHSKKLRSLEKLAVNLSESDIDGECGQFLIHIHGIYRVKNKSDISLLKEAASKIPEWNLVEAQFQFRPLSKKWDKAHKSIDSSIRDISKYLTKGGAKGGLRYSIDFPTEMPMSYDEYCAHCDRSNDHQRQALVEKGLVFDLPNLSHHEINQLALVNNAMMDWNKNRTGYIISCGKW